MSTFVQSLTQEQKVDLLMKAAKMLMKALRSTPGGVEALGALVMTDPETQEVFGAMLAMQSRGEL